MLCQRCHKNLATVRYAEVVDGKVADLHLCPECLSLQQEKAGGGFELSIPVAAQSVETGRPDLRRSRAPRACKACGFQLGWTLESGKMGCSQCYTAFADEIEPMLIGLHNAVLHRGKNLKMDDARGKLRSDLQTQRALLRSAVQKEHYEEAAQIRDLIRNYESRLGDIDSGHN